VIPASYATVRADGTKSYGSFAVDKLAEVGLVLLDWQAETLDELLECDEEGRLTRTTGVILCPRRNGKSALLLGRCLFGMMFLDEKNVVFSAHLADTARSAFQALEQITRHPKLRPRVRKMLRAEGREELHFDNGSVFTIRTRTGHGGRGREADLLVLDESLVLTEETVAALTPLTARAAARGRGQVLFASSAGTSGTESLVLNALRDKGRSLSGEVGDGFAYREWCADRLDDPADPETWRKANPSLGTRLLDERFLADARERLTAESYAREHLGIWADTSRLPLVESTAWAELAATSRPKPLNSSTWLTFDVSQDYTSSRVLSFFRTKDGRIAVRVIDALDDERGIDADWLAQRVLGLTSEADPDVIGYENLTGSHIASVLANHGWSERLRKITGARAAAGVAALLVAVRNGSVVHDGSEELAGDLSRAVGKSFGDGGTVFHRLSSASGGIPGAIALGAGFALGADELLA
jgi:hypothetical protein